MGRPNLFEISTKELTQDGFITWLLRWANPIDWENPTEDDKNLNECGKDFVQYLLKKKFPKNIDVESIESDRQWENIDIYAKVNNKYLIIIEDKTFTSRHSNQLETYSNFAQNWCKENHYELIPIYLKTGSEALSSLKIIEKDGFYVVERKDLIKFFTNYHYIENAIFKDFVRKINNLEEAEKTFETKEIKEWDSSCYIGFYHFCLDAKITEQYWKYLPNKTILTRYDEYAPSWGYTANPNGGFWGFRWHFRGLEDYCIYIQIEQADLCFKVGEVYKNHADIRNKVFGILTNKAIQLGMSEIVKPNRFGNGKYMTVAIVKREHWLGKDCDTLNTDENKNKVIENLKKYEKFLDSCLE